MDVRLEEYKRTKIPTNYVVAYAYSVNDRRTVLVLKDRPSYLKGVLNFPGGKIEEGESAVEAAVRELKEETGLDEIQEYDPSIYEPSEEVGLIDAGHATIRVVKVPVTTFQAIEQGKDETEPANWYDEDYLPMAKNLMPNLRLILQLLKSGLRGWKVEDQSGDWRHNEHFFVELFLRKPCGMFCDGFKVQLNGLPFYKDHKDVRPVLFHRT